MTRITISRLCLAGSLAFAGWSWPWSSPMEPLESPSGPGAQVPRLTRSATGLYMSWMQPLGKEAGLYFSRFEKGGWAPARLIVANRKFMINWADFPSLTGLEDGSLLAHWLEKDGPAALDYAAPFARSTDDGATWSAPVRPHRDASGSGDHGFVSVVPAGGGRAAVLWLDARQKTKFVESEIGEGEKPAMALYASFFEEGKFGREILLDDRVCDCCQTTAVGIGEEILAAYRDRSANETRDMSTIRFTGTENGTPLALYEDGWQIKGCPVNGPQAAALGMDVVVAWYTLAGSTPRVNAVFSKDGGRSFGGPIRIDLGNPEGRVGAILLPDGSAAVSWLERRPAEGSGAGEILVRRVRASGKIGKPRSVAMSTIKRRAGFPQMAASGDRLIFAWTELVGKSSKVRSASLQIGSLP